MEYKIMRFLAFTCAILSVVSLEPSKAEKDKSKVTVENDAATGNAGEHWQDAQMVNPCFEGKDNKPAKFKLPGDGFLVGLRFIHESGLVNCLARNKDWAAKWGCNTHSWNLKGKIGVVVTDKNKNVVLPVEARLQPRKNFYYTGGLSAMSNNITFYDDTHPNLLDETTELSLWYAEDLWNLWRHDNAGKVCLKAQVLFANV